MLCSGVPLFFLPAGPGRKDEDLSDLEGLEGPLVHKGEKLTRGTSPGGTPAVAAALGRVARGEAGLAAPGEGLPGRRAILPEDTYCKLHAQEKRRFPYAGTRPCGVCAQPSGPAPSTAASPNRREAMQNTNFLYQDQTWASALKEAQIKTITQMSQMWKELELKIRDLS